MRSAAQRARLLTRRLVGLAAILATALIAYGVLVGRKDDDFEQATAEDGRGYYLNHATLTEMGADGTPRIVLRADSIEQRIADDSVLMSDLTVDYKTPDDGLWKVTADRGRMPVDRKSLILSGDVRVTGDEARGSAVISTDNLTYDTSSSVIQTSDTVTVHIGTQSLQGRGLKVALNDGTLRLESNVHGRFLP
jgi:LPS export ABC transporter protein LptC